MVTSAAPAVTSRLGTAPHRAPAVASVLGTALPTPTAVAAVRGAALPAPTVVAAVLGTAPLAPTAVAAVQGTALRAALAVASVLGTALPATLAAAEMTMQAEVPTDMTMHVAALLPAAVKGRPTLQQPLLMYARSSSCVICKHSTGSFTLLGKSSKEAWQ